MGNAEATEVAHIAGYWRVGVYTSVQVAEARKIAEAAAVQDTGRWQIEGTRSDADLTE